MRMAALFHPKAKLWWQGRRNQKSHLAILPKHCIWMHCASLGEFEQGRPLLECIRQRHPEAPLVLSFYSPSGYEIRKTYPGVDEVLYLPLDSKKNAKQWIQSLQPKAAIFVKYDFWFNHLNAAQQAGCPIYVIAAHLDAQHWIFKPLAKPLYKLLQEQVYFLAQHADCFQRLQTKGFSVEMAGDPRVDRVVGIHASQDNKILDFVKGQKVFIAASLHASDLDLLQSMVQQIGVYYDRLIVVPHDLNTSFIEELQQRAGKQCVRYTTYDFRQDHHVLLLDTVGMLSSIYAYAYLCYVGGGFGKAIHNTLEPMAAGIPVLVGPRHKTFPEAVQMIERQGFLSLEDQGSFITAMGYFEKDENYEKSQIEINAYLKANKGATETIFKKLLQDHILEA